MLLLVVKPCTPMEHHVSCGVIFIISASTIFILEVQTVV